MRKRGLEPLRPNGHYPLKVACIPISPLPQNFVLKNIAQKEKKQDKCELFFRFLASTHHFVSYFFPVAGIEYIVLG